MPTTKTKPSTTANTSEQMEVEKPKIQMSIEKELTMEIPTGVKAPTEAFRKKQEVQKNKDRRMVRGVFNFYEVPGGTLEFVYRKYKGDPIKKYALVDGEVSVIPFGVAKHLNSKGWYPVHEHKLDMNGKPAVTIGKKVRRFGFHSLAYKDELQEVGASDIVTVQRAL